MCVAISLMPGSLLTPDEVFKMGTANGDGVGVAWAKDGKVRWYKTLKYNVGQLANMIEQGIDYPRLVHFRYATVGGTRVDLCHPFEVSERANCEAVGTGDRVMIHNGHFHRYKELYEVMDKEGLLPDKGPWSDTRLVAYLASKDLDWLQVMIQAGGKVALLDGDGQFTHLGDWQNLREGVRVSNLGWNHDGVYKRGGYSGFHGPKAWEGWDDSWTAETHAAHQKAQAEAAEARYKAAKEAREQREREKTNETEVKKFPPHFERQGESEKEGPGRSRGGSGGDSGSARENGSVRHGRQDLPAHSEPNGTRGGYGGGRIHDGVRSPGGAGHGTRVEDGPRLDHQGEERNLVLYTHDGRARIVRTEPWTNPATGRTYRVEQGEKGSVVVEVPPDPIRTGDDEGGTCRDA